MTSSPEPTSIATSLQWPRLETTSADILRRARWEAINVVQWLARIANSYVSGNTEERLVLRFRPEDAAFITGTFDNKLALEMRLSTLEMQFLEDDRPAPHILDPEEHSPAEIEAWLLVELLHRGVDRGKFTKSLPYSIPDLMSGDAEDHSPQSCLPGLAILEAWFRNAAAVLQAAAARAPVQIVCWPQDLNLKCQSGDAKPDRFGFSPGEAQQPEPFFYVNSTAEKRSILTASDLLAQPDPTAAVKTFLQSRH